ncbi:MAG: hypothetical protein PVJ53_08310 [Desulfobacterales bacterium]
MRLIKTALVVSLVLLSPMSAKAYVGPGLGAGTIGVVLGVIGSIFIALFAFLWYPIKRIFKKKKKSKTQDTHQ